MSVNPGRLRDRITIQRGTTTITPGGTTRSWSNEGSVWARVTQVSALGTAKYQQAGYSNVTHTVITRAVSARLADTRFLWRGRVLEPVAPSMDRANTGRFASVACREVTDVVSSEAGES